MGVVEFREVTQIYHHRAALKNVSFTLEAGRFSVIFGQPGSGKSIILRLLVGLERPRTGSIYLRGVDVTQVEPQDRNLAYVPQAFALYPHYSVYDNIAYPLTLRGMRHDQIDAAVQQTAKMLGIDHLLRKRPDQLSGGEKQRVAMGRGIVKHTDVYVLDDPLAGLDFKLRERLFDDLKEMQQSLKATFIYATSEPLEALMLADDIIVMADGEAIESGSTDQVYWQPKRLQTTVLLGYPRTNVLTGEVSLRDGQAWCRTALHQFPVELTAPADARTTSGAVLVAMRPIDLQLNPPEQDGLLRFQARLVLLEDLGGELVVHLDAQGMRLVAVTKHEEFRQPEDHMLTIGMKPSAITLFAAEDGRVIGKGV